VTAIWAEAVKGADRYEDLFPIRRADGEYRWFQARGQAIWDETGRMTRMAGSLRDVTDRKQAQDALRRNEQLLQTVADNTTAIIYVKDIDGRFLFINRSFEQLFHLTTQQIIGHTNYEIFPREIADAFRANCKSWSGTGRWNTKNWRRTRTDCTPISR